MSADTESVPAQAGFTYAVRIEDGHSLDIAGDFTTRATVSAVVVRSDGVTVWRGGSFWKGKDMRGQRLKAHNEMRLFAGYHARHGRCWYDVNRQEKAAQKAEKRAAEQRRARVASKSMELLAALRDAVGLIGLPIHPKDAMETRKEWLALIELADPSSPTSPEKKA